jgi:transposase
MKSFYISELPLQEEITLKEMERRHPTPRVRKKATIVLMSNRKLNQSGISNALGVSRNFVSRTLRSFEKSGFLGLVEHHPGATPKLNDEQMEQFVHWIELGPREYNYNFVQWTTSSLQWRLKVVYNIKLSEEGIRQLLHRLGFTWKRAQKIYAKVDETARIKCKAELTELFEKAWKKEIILLFQDEAIAKLTTTIKNGWSRRGKQLKIPSWDSHKRYVIFAIVDPITGDTHYRTFLENINTESMKKFINHIKRFYQNSNIPVWMVMDNHPAHKGNEVKQLLEKIGIHLFYLSPHSPDFNCIERLWKWLRGRNLHNAFFQNMQKLLYGIRVFFSYISGNKEKVVRRLT